MIITEKVEGRGRTMLMTLKLKGDKVRMDVTPQMSTIVDTATGDTTTVLNATKTFMTMSKDQMAQLRTLKGGPDGEAATPAAKPKLVDTGKSEKVGPYNCKIYTMETPESHFTFWATKDIPNYAAAEEQLKKFRAMGNTGATSAPDTSDMQGIAAKTQINTNGETLTITIVSAQDKPIDDSEMAPPAGYTRVSMP
jgi:hypothetical protein